MSTQSLRNYLLTKPTTVASASALARTYGVDVKSATRILRSCGYALVETPQGQLWQHAPLDSPMVSLGELAMISLQDCRVFTVSESTLNLILSRIPTSPPDRDPPPDEKLGAKAVRLLYNDFLRIDPSDRDEFATILVAAALTYCLARGMLPLRAEITTSGFKPLTQSINSKAD